MSWMITLMASTVLSAGIAQVPEPIAPVPPVVPDGLPDAARVLSPSRVHIGGWLGARIDANAKNRLLKVDTEPLLEGYRKRPGNHPWIGEHVGKWLHAATLAWVYTGDAALKSKLDQVVAELVACQEPDGYLGTYVPDKRFGLFQGADWDVWSHKYNLIGLLTYYQYTRNKAALGACCKMGDLLIATFPSRKSILAAGTHVGMAATSVLEPIVLLYRFTGESRYLDFARYIVKSWDELGGPKIMATLLIEKRVDKTANGKAYEMLSNLVGLCELARATGDRKLLEPALNAWSDIVANRLYVTGSASAGEHFKDNHVLPNQVRANICETCVTTTWIQLNLQLLRLTGESKYGDELERSVYNHLAAAQHPRGDDWCYYTALEGKKPYDSGINCCHSSGPRGMALAAQAGYLTVRQGEQEGLIVNTFETSQASFELDGQKVSIRQESQFPREGKGTLTINTVKPARFSLLIRVPAWVGKPPWGSRFKMEIDGKSANFLNREGYAVSDSREWKSGDQVNMFYELSPHLLKGSFGDAGLVAITWGPFVLAYDQARNPGLPPADSAGLIDRQPLVSLEPGPDLALRGQVVGRNTRKLQAAIFVPFADAGSTGGLYRVWLRVPGV
jgi:DUF1680 family protein